jgi:hypothetical protein
MRSAVVLDVYKQIPKDILVKLIERYKNDMDIFGYTFDLDTFKAVCDMNGCC